MHISQVLHSLPQIPGKWNYFLKLSELVFA